jgi:hypothetical protein
MNFEARWQDTSNACVSIFLVDNRIVTTVISADNCVGDVMMEILR